MACDSISGLFVSFICILFFGDSVWLDNKLNSIMYKTMKKLERIGLRLRSSFDGKFSKFSTRFPLIILTGPFRDELV